MNLKVKTGLIVLVLLLVVACSDKSNSSEGAKAEGSDYPKQDIDIIAGGGPGGGTDLFSRAVARELSEILDVNVNVVNMPGAAGSVASKELDKRKADGYTIMPTTSDLQINIASERTEDYLEKFDALARIHEDTYLLWISEESEFETS